MSTTTTNQLFSKDPRYVTTRANLDCSIPGLGSIAITMHITDDQ